MGSSTSLLIVNKKLIISIIIIYLSHINYINNVTAENPIRKRSIIDNNKTSYSSFVSSSNENIILQDKQQRQILPSKEEMIYKYKQTMSKINGNNNVNLQNNNNNKNVRNEKIKVLIRLKKDSNININTNSILNNNKDNNSTTKT